MKNWYAGLIVSLGISAVIKELGNMMMISLVLVLAVVIITVLLAAGVKSEDKQGGEAVIKKVYIYVVLFATLMMTIGGSVAAFMAVADIVAPAPYQQSFEEYKQYGYEKTNVNNTPELSEDELMTRYQSLVNGEKQRQIDRAWNSLIKSLGWIIIPLPVFVFFQRRLNKDRDDM